MNFNDNDKTKISSSHDDEEYEQVEVWSEEWQCNIMGLAQRGVGAGAGAGAEVEKKMKNMIGQRRRHAWTTGRGTKAKARVSDPVDLGQAGPAGHAAGRIFRENAHSSAKADRSTL